MNKGSIGAVIVTYKTKDLLKKCLDSLSNDAGRTGLSLEVVVVDNASDDRTVEMVNKEFPAVTLIANPVNSGPARAFNQGISEIIDRVDATFILNSDIEVQTGTLEVMINYLETNHDVDGVSGPLLNEDGSRQMTRTHIWSLGRPDYKQKFRVEFVGTTFALIRTGVFRRIGGYDENYYFYNEDLDWAERARRERCYFIYLPEAKVVHFLGRGRIQNQSQIIQKLYPSSIYYCKKFYRQWSWLTLWLLHIDIIWRIFKLQVQLMFIRNTKAGTEITRSIADYREARAQMNREYRTERLPRIPLWKK